MAATLVEGREYGLASNVSTSGNKTFIHFKLTDSALRALEEYSTFKGGCSRKPTIQFTHSDGVMCIPGQVSSDDPKAERSFKLNLAKIHGDINGSFDCIQQTAARQGASSLQCLGSMQFKITTHANNDVYNDTRKKIAIADTESRKACAKEIKMSGRFSGKKIKKVIPSSQYKAMHPAKPANSWTSSRSSPASIPTPSSNPLHSSSSLVSNRLTPPPTSAHSPHRPLNGSRVGSKPVSAFTSSNGVSKIAGSKSSSGAINMPYRDRVIHLLALRPYKKPELLIRLMKDGIRDKDKDMLGGVLKSVAMMNKDNSYSLAKHAWQDVRSDWPYYTDIDRQLLKKNQQHLESRSSVSPSVSPAVRPGDSPSPPQKRSSDDLPDFNPSKKQRISHHEKHQSRSNGKLPNGTVPNSTLPNGTVPNGKFPNGTVPNGKLPNGTVPNGKLPTAANNNHRAPNGAVTVVTSGFGDKDSPIPESPSSNRENQEKADDMDTSPDYLTQYTSIETCEQRHRYKQDFNSEYEEYRRLHEKVQNVTRRFQHLKERILNTEEGSQEFEKLRNKVLQEYEQQKSDSKFMQRKQRVNYLHGKLGHIKRLITEYDRNHHIKDCS